MMLRGVRLGAILSAVAVLFLLPAVAGKQREEDLSASVRTHLHGQLTDRGAKRAFFDSAEQEQRWLNNMSARLVKILPRKHVLQNEEGRRDFLYTVHYEASRAGLPPQLILAVVHVESAFRKYAISSAGARGYMQVMPFWVNNIGEDKHNLFSLRTNLRYGAVILRHYLDIEDGDLSRALGRYNGSLGKSVYPNAIFNKLDTYWQWQ